MGSDWSLLTLGELGTLKNGANFGSSDYGKDHPVVSVKSLFRGRFAVTEELDAIKSGVLKNIDNFLLKKDDILFARSSLKRSGSGQCAIVGNHQAGTIFSGFTIRFRTSEGIAVLPLYLLYNFQSPQSREQFARIATGTTISNLSQSNLASVTINLPPLWEQKAIAHILGTLDDKIELNRQTNQTLEAMAQALFKSWFVDFDPVIDNALAAGKPIPEALQPRAQQRAQQQQNAAANGQQANPNQNIHSHFPDEFTYTEQLGWIPKGWNVKRSEEVATVTIGKTPPRKLQECFSELADGNWPWVSIKDLGSSGMFANTSSEYLTPEAVEQYNVKIVPTNTILLSFKLTVGRVAIASCEVTTNEAIAHFYNLSDGVNHQYLYQYLRCFDYNSLGSTSSIATAVNSKTVKAMPILIPSGLATQQFANATEGWFTKIMSIENETMTLTKLRNTLLPKLISGELRIPDAEKLVAEAGL